MEPSDLESKADVYNMWVAKKEDITTQLKQLEGQDTINAEIKLLDALSKQVWYGFKNKREVVFDCRTGDFYPNFKYVEIIRYFDWSKKKESFSPAGMHGDWKLLHEAFYFDKALEKNIGFLNSSLRNNYDYRDFDFPKKFRCASSRWSGSNTKMIVYCKKNNQGELYYACCISSFTSEYSYSASRASDNSRISISNNTMDLVFPVLKVLNNQDLLPESDKLSKHEKSRVIVDFFVKNNLIPVFDADYINNEDDRRDELEILDRIYGDLLSVHQLKHKLALIEKKLETLPPPVLRKSFATAFDYRQALQEQQYDLNNINQSVWQYSQAVQAWARFLLTQLDDITQRQQPLLAQAAELKHALTAKPISSKHLTDTELQLLQARHHDLQQRLDFGIEPVRAALFSVLQQAQTLQNQLQQAHQYPDSLMRLAELERQPRPSFNLVAEHTATLCTQALTKLEWLEQSLKFVQAIVQSEQQHTESYLVLLDKYQADLLQQGTANSIEASDVQQWFTEWRQQHLIAQQQWQPLVQAGLEHALPPQAVLDTLQAMQHYQQAVDQFYLGERLGIHTTYAFQANGHRQEKLEKEQKLTELRHKLMQQLEAVIFALPSSVEKIWLVRWVEVWQQGLVQAITDLLQHEQLIERDDIVQIMLEDMRKVQQQNLAACLQDAKSYSQALAMREKDTATLIFKMRKALMK